MESCLLVVPRLYVRIDEAPANQVAWYDFLNRGIANVLYLTRRPNLSSIYLCSGPNPLIHPILRILNDLSPHAKLPRGSRDTIERPRDGEPSRYRGSVPGLFDL